MTIAYTRFWNKNIGPPVRNSYNILSELGEIHFECLFGGDSPEIRVLKVKIFDISIIANLGKTLCELENLPMQEISFGST